MENIYRIESLRHCYREKPVLNIDALSIRRSSIVGLIGPNGSGKSTLLNLLGFIRRLTEGRILYKGQPAAPFSSVIRSKVTLLPQEPYLMKRSVFANIAYGLKARRFSGDIDARVEGVLAQVGLPAEQFLRRKWYELSGGEAQRVSLAARLILRPEVLLLDEPTRAVDAASAQMIKDASLAARDQWGTTLIIASHDWEWLDEVCDQVIHLFRGRVLADGKRNIIFGPWQQNRSGGYEKKLQDGQRIQVGEPPDEGAVAIIDPSDFSIEKKTAGGGEADLPRLWGRVTRMALDRETDKLILTIRVGNMTLAVRVERDRLKQMDLLPGQKAVLSYRPRHVKWMTGPHPT